MKSERVLIIFIVSILINVLLAAEDKEPSKANEVPGSLTYKSYPNDRERNITAEKHICILFKDKIGNCTKTRSCDTFL